MSAWGIRIPGESWAWGYGRQSSQDKVEQGIPRQGDFTRGYWEFNLRPRGVEKYIFVPDESAVSARTNPFMLRYAGRTLMTLMQPGDHFIIDKIDRLWRSNEDFVDVMRKFRERQITLHICNLMGANVQLGTPMGDFFMNVMVSIAQLESDQVSDRTKRFFQNRRNNGLWGGSLKHIPIGCRVEGTLERCQKTKRTLMNNRTLHWDEQYRFFMSEIVRLADDEGKTASEISKMHKHLKTLCGVDWWKKHVEAKKHVGPTQVVSHYWREKQYRILPPFDPNRVKFEIFRQTEDKFRDIGRNLPSTPNPYPFLDGRPIPTSAEQLYKLSEAI